MVGSYFISGGKGNLEDLAKRAMIAEGLTKAQRCPGNSKGLELQELIISAIETRINNQKTYGGLILFVDEMGKLLEAASEGDGDVYFYQLLAEAATQVTEGL